MDNSIVFDNVSYTYNLNTPFAFNALDKINLSIPAHEVTAIIGHTGSGKSTLIQHLNVLLRPTEGTVTIAGESVTAESEHGSLKALRKKVGVVFQFPESQLFEETVLKDVMFGPKNFGATDEEAAAIAIEKLELVGLPKYLYERSPFDLSGGQMRRVAIAGVLALEPEVLVLDEPTAGLDPLGHLRIMEMFLELQKKENLTLIMVTHQMDDVAKYAENVIVLEQGTVAKTGSRQEVFAENEWLESKQLGVPRPTNFLAKVEKDLDQNIHGDKLPMTVNELADVLISHRANQVKGDV